MKLAEYMAKYNVTPKDLAKELNVTTQYIGMLCREQRIPSIGIAYKIQLFTNNDVPISIWANSLECDQ